MEAGRPISGNGNRRRMRASGAKQLRQKMGVRPKAWSQNLGQEKVLTTFMSYGSVAGERQADILNELLRKTVDGVDSGEPYETTCSRISTQEGLLVRNCPQERPEVDCW